MAEKKSVSSRVREFPRSVNDPAFFRSEIATLGKNWGWFLAAGIAFVVIGIAAFLWPIRSTVSLTFALGTLFILGGIFYLIKSIQLRKEPGNGWRIFQAIVSIVAGALIFRYPGAGMMGVTIAMTFYFFVSAATRAVIAFGLQPLKGWGWTLVSAIAAFILGVYTMATFPVSALWLPGLVLGIDFVIHGASLIGVSMELRRLHERRPPRERTAAA